MISFVKISSDYQRVVFAFDMEIINILKTIPGFRYKNKMWFIPISQTETFEEKFDLMEKCNENETKNKKIEQKLEYDVDESRHVFYSINANNDVIKKHNEIEVTLLTDEVLKIHLPVSKYIYAKLHSTDRIKLSKKMSERRFWLVNGLQNIQNLYEICENANIEIKKKNNEEKILLN